MKGENWFGKHLSKRLAYQETRILGMEGSGRTPKQKMDCKDPFSRVGSGIFRSNQIITCNLHIAAILERI